MEWSNLSILNAAIVGKEVDTAINLLKRYYEDSNPKLQSLVESMKRRSEELEVFFGQNDDGQRIFPLNAKCALTDLTNILICAIDERAVLFEKERMKLRKALQSVVGVISPTYSSSKQLFPAATDQPIAIEELQDTKRTTRSEKTFSPEKTVSPDTFLVSPRAVAQSKSKAIPPHPMTKRMNTQIYAWEGGREQRGKIQIDENSYVPTSVPGVYAREDGNEQSSSDKWLDVKVVLTQEELTTLAARKKAMKRAKNLGLSSTNFVSVQSSTPYIDPHRIIKETYRPDQPDKWILPVYHNK
jgi:hypothetical protein